MSAERSWADAEEEFDVVVVGFGAAGTAAAIEAAEAGARVVAVDRWGRGGASARSGGVVYEGGGTEQQRAAGFEDDPELMLRYLALEEDVAIDDARLRRFCDRSLEDHGWLVAHGVSVPMGFDPSKAVVPVDDTTGLYFSGNEKHYNETVPAVPRGHRVAGAGMSGHDLMVGLHRAAAAAGVDVRAPARLVRLVQEPDGHVKGVDVLVLGTDPLTRMLHAAGYRLMDLAGSVLRRVPRRLAAAMDRLEERRGRRVSLTARLGVVLATGGFSFNRDLMESVAPSFARAMPLGTPGDDGAGITAAQGAGAAVRSMDRCGASRFYSPPAAFSAGILVDGEGRRVCDESLYAATLSTRIAEHGGRAWLVVDAAIRRDAREEIRAAPPLRSRPLRQLLNGRANHVVFIRLFGSINLYLNRVTSPTLAGLARRIGIPADALEATVDTYNERARNGLADEMGKPAELFRPLGPGPWAAVPCHLDSLLFPAPCITLGGIDVDDDQRVRRPDGTSIGGLYAVGRCAAGVASRSYVSGLSLADCVFSGRNAGMTLAGELPARRTGSGARMTRADGPQAPSRSWT
jgi:3-oxo-5alpha-steroid 4-dehydrogenase